MLDLRQFEHRVDSLEESMRDYFNRLEGLDARQTITEEEANTQLQAGHQNYVPNGDFDYSRNAYYYTTDYTSVDGRTDADVSKECTFWFVSERDTAKENEFGSITASDSTLTLSNTSKAVFESGEVGNEIVVEGAGASGADLVTTIATYTDTDEVELTDSALTTVSNVRVRWNLQELKEDSTDVDYEAGESPPSLIGDTNSDSIYAVTTTHTIAVTNNQILTILANATSGAFTVTLPSAEKATGKIITVKKIDVSANVVTIDGDASETIDGATTKSLSTQYDIFMMQSDGSNWHIL